MYRQIRIGAYSCRAQDRDEVMGTIGGSACENHLARRVSQGCFVTMRRERGLRYLVAREA